VPENTPRLRLFMIRYRHNHEVIDITGRGENARDAFERYLARMVSWGNNARDYQFISAWQMPDQNAREER